MTQRRSRPARGPELGPRRTLTLASHQHVRPLDLRLLRRILRHLLWEAWRDGDFDLAVHVLAASEMTRLNETFLRHHGPTDVITFDYAERAGERLRPSRSHVRTRRSRERRDAYPVSLHGEVFICIDEALSQARRFHTTWQSELGRYIVHGLLHLLGYDDATRRARRKMKAAEDSLVRKLARQFDFRRISRQR